jgi:hypothetical protein
MLSINKIKIGDEMYNIIPELGDGLQLGTGLTNKHIIYLNIGTAKLGANPPVEDCGVCIDTLGFRIDPVKFKAFIKALGFKEE